jgi:hypothetical protein
MARKTPDPAVEQPLAGARVRTRSGVISAPLIRGPIHAAVAPQPCPKYPYSFFRLSAGGRGINLCVIACPFFGRLPSVEPGDGRGQYLQTVATLLQGREASDADVWRACHAAATEDDSAPLRP